MLVAEAADEYLYNIDDFSCNKTALKVVVITFKKKYEYNNIEHDKEYLYLPHVPIICQRASCDNLPRISL